MTAYDSIERGAADECEPLRGRRSRTFTLTQLLVACGAVCVCAIGATTVVNTHLANFDDDHPGGARLGWWTAYMRHHVKRKPKPKPKPAAPNCPVLLKKTEDALKDYATNCGKK